MRVTHTAIIVATAVALAAPALCAAQEPVSSFEQIGHRLKPGDPVVVRSASRLEVRGTLRDIGASSLTIDHEGLRVFQADEIREVALERPRSKRKWAGWGFLSGAAFGAALAVVSIDDKDAGFVDPSTAALIMGGFAGGVGALIGALAAIEPARPLVYRAPASPGGRQALLRVAPIATPRKKGVAVAFSF